MIPAIDIEIHVPSSEDPADGTYFLRQSQQDDALKALWDGREDVLMDRIGTARVGKRGSK